MKTVKTILAITAAFLLLGFAGTMDYTEEVIYNMPQTAYENIVLKLGRKASKQDIVREYMENKNYYDTLEVY